MSTVVDVQDLTKKFGSFTAVDRIEFSVKKREIFGFLGANGAGKSTTIRILCGIQKPSKGKAFVLGEDIAKNPRRIKQSIGYMSQKFTLYDDLSVLENIQFFGGIHRLSSKKLEERSRLILSMSGLEGRERTRTSELPGGWKQRLALGCSIIHEPRILFLDEPTAGVDPAARRVFWNIIHELREAGTTIFVTSHYMDEVENCDRIALMHRGRIAALDSPEELKKNIIPGPVFELLGNLPAGTETTLRKSGFFERIDPFGRGFHAVGHPGWDPATGEREIRKLLGDTDRSTAMKIRSIHPGLEDVFVYLIGNLEEQDAAKD